MTKIIKRIKELLSEDKTVQLLDVEIQSERKYNQTRGTV